MKPVSTVHKQRTARRSATGLSASARPKPVTDRRSARSAVRAECEFLGLEVRSTGRYGKGVFAEADIAKGRVIHILGGDTMTCHDLVQRVNSGQERIDDPLQVGRRTYIDLDEFSRSFNHSCDPNTGIRKRSELFALRDIRQGEEITYDYSATIAPTVWQMECHCGAKNCRKTLGDVRSIPKRQLRK